MLFVLRRKYDALKTKCMDLENKLGILQNQYDDLIIQNDSKIRELEDLLQSKEKQIETFIKKISDKENLRSSVRRRSKRISERKTPLWKHKLFEDDLKKIQMLPRIYSIPKQTLNETNVDEVD